MLTSIHSLLTSLATWPIVSLLLVGFIVCQQGFGWRQKKLGYTKPPDVLGWYTPTQIRHLFKSWGPSSRTLYAWTEVTLDFAFLLIYGTLFGVLLAQLFRSGWTSGLVLVPLAGAAADLAENTLLTWLVCTYDGQEHSVVWVAACFTALKIILFVASLLLLLAGGAGKLLGWL
jgi:hypothetical protein